MLALVFDFGSTGRVDGALHHGTMFVVLLLMLPRSLDCNTLCFNV